MQIMTASIVGQSLFVAVSLGVPDQRKSARQTSAELAAMDAEALEAQRSCRCAEPREQPQ